MASKKAITKKNKPLKVSVVPEETDDLDFELDEDEEEFTVTSDDMTETASTPADDKSEPTEPEPEPEPEPKPEPKARALKDPEPPKPRPVVATPEKPKGQDNLTKAKLTIVEPIQVKSVEEDCVTVTPRVTAARVRIGPSWYAFIEGKPVAVPKAIVSHLKKRKMI